MRSHRVRERSGSTRELSHSGACAVIAFGEGMIELASLVTAFASLVTAFASAVTAFASAVTAFASLVTAFASAVTAFTSSVAARGRPMTAHLGADRSPSRECGFR